MQIILNTIWTTEQRGLLLAFHQEVYMNCACMCVRPIILKHQVASTFLSHQTVLYLCATREKEREEFVNFFVGAVVEARARADESLAQTDESSPLKNKSGWVWAGKTLSKCIRTTRIECTQLKRHA